MTVVELEKVFCQRNNFLYIKVTRSVKRVVVKEFYLNLLIFLFHEVSKLFIDSISKAIKNGVKDKMILYLPSFLMT